MPRFAYSAIDNHGKERTGKETAADSKQLAANLKAQGLAPIAISLVADMPAKEKMKDRAAVRSSFRLPGMAVVSRKELTVFTRQLATLLRAGLPLLRGLEVLARQERNVGWRRIMEEMIAGIRSGGTLSAALSCHPKVFDRLYVNMVKAGEAGGVLAVVLGRLAQFLEKSQHLRSKVTAALFYPVLVLLVAAVILAGLLVFVVPKFEQIFADLLKGAPLPALTQGVLSVSTLCKDHFGEVVGVILIAGLLIKVWRQTSTGARLFASGALSVPVVGDFLLKGTVARLARTFGTLLSSGVPMLPALLITRDACANVRVAEAIAGVHEQVKQGAGVATTFATAGIFPPMVMSLLDVGEHTGELPEMLGKIADIYDEEVDHAVTGLSSLIEPLLILFLALVVGTIVIALFLPIVRIVQLLT